jgi:hypothetical protein
MSRKAFCVSVLFLQGKSGQKGRHTYALWEGKIFLFEDVPEDVYQQGGETYFSPNVLEAMDKIANSDMEPKTRVAVPVFSMSDTVQ